MTGMAPPPRFPLLEVALHAIAPDDAERIIVDWITRRDKQYLSVCTADTLLQCHDDPRLAAVVNGAGLAVPDGMPLVWIGRLKGFPAHRIYGPDLMLRLCDRGRTRGLRHFFYGGTEPLLEDLEQRLKTRFPGLLLAGSWAPPFRPLRPDEECDVAARINAANPDIVWVGIGTPRQDFWVRHFRDRLDAPVLIPVGAAFNFHAGAVPQAPAWMGQAGLEWLFRLIREPRRLWKRYLLGNPRFIGLVIRDACRRVRGPA